MAFILFIVVTITVLIVFRVSTILGDKLLSAEQAIKANEEKLKFYTDNAPMAVIEWDSDFIVTRWTGDSEKIFGWNRAEVIGKEIMDLNMIYEPDIPTVEKTMEKLTSGSFKQVFSTNRNYRKDRSIIHCEWYNTILKDQNGDMLFVLSQVLDITKRIQEEEELKENEKKLQQLNVDKDRFISILSHDLKNPFNALLGLSDLLKENIRRFEIGEIENLVNHINQSAQNTYNLLEDILMWARIESDKITINLQKLSLKDICDDVLEIFNPIAKAKGITINYIPQDQIDVFADIEMLKMVLRNLVSNAIKFTDKGGEIKINAEENSGNITISVSDNGTGIKPDNLTKLFDISQVFTTKGTAEETGTGLGLLLCKEFVEKHGGRIWVESEWGKGSIFYFTVPYIPESNEKIVVTDVAEDNHIRNLKILIADDNESLRLILTEMVKMFAKDFFYASTGLEAVAACQNNPDLDLILMDYLMPELNGDEAAKQIRHFNKNVIIFLQTAFTLPEGKKETIGEGINDYFSKPYNMKLFNQLINKHFD